MSRDFISVSSLTVSHLKQVSDRISTIKQQQLVKLDQMINTYLLKRRQSKAVSQAEQSFETRIRSQLISLEEKNEYLMKQLEIITKNYQKQQEQIKIVNKDFNHFTEEINQQNPFEELIHQLICQLTPYTKITQYLQRFQTLKKGFIDKYRFANNVQEYFERVDQIVTADQIQQCFQSQKLQDYYLEP